jgi:hypothetical protein
MEQLWCSGVGVILSPSFWCTSRFCGGDSVRCRKEAFDVLDEFRDRDLEFGPHLGRVHWNVKSAKLMS